MAGDVTDHLADRIFDELKSVRLELGGKIDVLSKQVTEHAAEWTLLRPILLGNGKPAMAIRVDRIEGIVARVRWVLTAVVAPVAVYGVYALMQRWLKLP